MFCNRCSSVGGPIGIIIIMFFTWQIPVSSIGEKTGTSLEKLFFTDDDSAPLPSSTEELDTEREEDKRRKGQRERNI